MRQHRPVRLAIHPYVGAMVADDGDLEAAGAELDPGVIVGGRLTLAIGRHWEIEGAYGFARLKLEASEFVDFPTVEGEVDMDATVAYGGVNYLVGSDQADTRLLLSLGVGGMKLEPEDGDAETQTLVSVGAGFTHPVTDRISFRGEFRDHISFCEAPIRAGQFSACSSDEALNNIEVSGGLQFWLF